MKFVEVLNDQGKRYDSYEDYWRLIELSGFEIVKQNAIDFGSKETLIVSPANGNVAEWVKQPRNCKMICWLLERPTGGLNTFLPAGFDEIWLSDRWLADQFKSDPRVKFVPVGGHPQLCPRDRLENEKWDFAHFAYTYGRRQRIVNEITAPHATMNKPLTIAPNAWGVEKRRILSQCRAGLCTHQDDLPIIEPLRYTLFACAKLPIFAEYSNDPFPYSVLKISDIQDVWAYDHFGHENYETVAHLKPFPFCVFRGLGEL